MDFSRTISNLDVKRTIISLDVSIGNKIDTDSWFTFNVQQYYFHENNILQAEGEAIQYVITKEKHHYLTYIPIMDRTYKDIFS